MPIEDTRPKMTKSIEDIADGLDALAAWIPTGKAPASTPLFRSVARLCRSADKLYRVAELELHAQLAPVPLRRHQVREVAQ